MSPNSKTMKKRSTAGSINTQTLLDFDLEESSDDSDFRIEDHDDDSDDFSVNSNDDGSDGNGSGDDSDDDEDDEDSDNDFANFKNDCSESNNGVLDTNMTAAQVLAQAKMKEALEKANAKMLATPICCACLGDRSDDTNEIVECDNCGISVHEGCYGISDSVSVSSTVSSCSTEPWFCEACKANIVSPVCELCPNKGGIFKETDVGKWVHLVCALYVPGVAFGEVDHLSSVTLFEMQYSKWGAKTCSLCEDARYSRCGVCIGCDAGMCKTYFHVTCAQAAGLLSETHSEEADHADPFYAHCKIHSDKTLIKRRKRNFYALKMKMEYRSVNTEQKKAENSSSEQQRIERKLKKHRNKYISNKAMKSEPWVPTQKMPRLLSTSASACRRLILKAELMGIDTAALEFQEAQMATLADIRKKWHISPAFSVEFIGYYLDRITRSKEIKTNLQHQLELNKKLVNEQQILRDKYDEAMRIHAEQAAKKESLNEVMERLQSAIRALCPNKSLISMEAIGRPAPAVVPPVIAQPVSRPMAVPTAAALKMGVGFPLTNLPGINDDTNRVLSTQCQGKEELMHECGICKRCNDQHLLAKCDTCHLHYHLGCLSPPLTRHPKKSKIYGWQCSECDEDNPEGVVTLTTGPRKSRTKYAKDGTIVPVDSSFDISADEVRDECMAALEFNDKPKTNFLKTLKKTEKNGQDPKLSDPAIPSDAPSTNDVTSDSTYNFTSDSETKSPMKRKRQKNTAVSEVVGDLTQSNQIQSSAPSHNKTDVLHDPLAPVEDPLDISINSNASGAIPVLNGKVSSIDIPDAPIRHKQKNKNSKKMKRDKEALETSTPTKDHEATKTSGVNSIEGNESASNNLVVNLSNGISATGNEGEPTHKHNRKRRKEKHRNKHGPDGKRSPSKEHKKKRKRKNHDIENPNSAVSSDGVPKIKIKFKALPLPGETAAESHFFYVPADMVRPRELPRSRPVSVDSDELLSTPVLDSSFPAPLPPTSSVLKPPAMIRSRRMSVLLSPPKALALKRGPSTVTNVSISSVTEGGEGIECYVCHVAGTPQDLVKCDECKKCYHFGCLEPPLKKTPKRRGYSWHCADCDPTDKEDN